MTRTKPFALALSLSLACSLALPSVGLAQEPASTEAPVIVVTSEPAPAPPPPVLIAPAPARPTFIDPHRASLLQQRNSGLGMTISGFTMFGTSYLISALIGTISIDYANSVDGSGKYGRRMLIPIAGPFLAIPRSDSATGGLFTGLLGVIQVGGFVLGSAGAIKYGRAKRQLELSASSGGLQLKF
jgi:hypothetical protein